MAESIIKSTQLGFKVLAESSNTNETIANKLQRLQSAYASLSDNEKALTFVLYGTDQFYPSTDRYTSTILISGNREARINSISIPDAIFIMNKLTASGISFTDISSETRTVNIRLCKYV